MAKLGRWEVDPVICNQADGPEVLTLFFEYTSQAQISIGGATSAQAREMAAAFIAIADKLDAQIAADAKFNAQFTAAMLADEGVAA